MKKLTVAVAIFMALVGVGTVFAADIESRVEAVRPLTRSEGRDAAWADAVSEYGQSVFDKVLADGGDGELTEAEGHILSWMTTTSDANQLRAIVSADIRTAVLRKAAQQLALRPGTSDAEIVALAPDLGYTNRVSLILRRRQWDSPEGRAAYIASWLGGKLGLGAVHPAHRVMFRQYAQSLPAAEALSVLEDEIRGLLTASPSEERDDWIRELRAQHVILRDLAGE